MTIDIYREFDGFGFERFPSYALYAKDEIKKYHPRVNRSWSDTIYGTSIKYENSRIYHRNEFEYHGCFGGLFRFGSHRDPSSLIVTVGVLYRDPFRKESLSYRKIWRDWYNFSFNLYEDIIPNVEFHFVRRKVPITDGKTKLVKLLAGYSFDLTKVPIEPMLHVLQLVRATSENPRTIFSWHYYMKNGVNPIFALWLAHRVVSAPLRGNVRDEDVVEFVDLGRGGGHVFMPKGINLEAILKGKYHDNIDYSRRLSDRMKARKEVMSLLAGGFSPVNFVNYLDGTIFKETADTVLGVNVDVKVLDDKSVTAKDIVDIALKIQKEF